ALKHALKAVLKAAIKRRGSTP
ncbi:MAG: hypothetical protein RIR10_858, partial [Planctomycetota bacterium]